MLISGYYGFGNFGDEALLDVIVTRLRAAYPAGTDRRAQRRPGRNRRALERRRDAAHGSRRGAPGDRPRRRRALRRRRLAAERDQPAQPALLRGHRAHRDARGQADDDLRAIGRAARRLRTGRGARVLRRGCSGDGPRRAFAPAAWRRCCRTCASNRRPIRCFSSNRGAAPLDLAAEGLDGPGPLVVVSVRRWQHNEATTAFDRRRGRPVSERARRAGRILAARRAARCRRFDHRDPAREVGAAAVAGDDTGRKRRR